MNTNFFHDNEVEFSFGVFDFFMFQETNDRFFLIPEFNIGTDKCRAWSEGFVRIQNIADKG